MSAPTVDERGARSPDTPDRPGSSDTPRTGPPLPWPLRIVAAIGRLLLRVRRGIRRVFRRIVTVTERVGRSPVIAAPVAALSVALVGMLVVALPVAGAWWGGVEPPGTWQDAVSVTGSVWVMTYGVPMRLMGVDYTLIPWGLMLIPAWLGHQAGRWLVRVMRPRSLPPLIASWAIAVVLGSGVVAAVSVLADIPAVQTSARRAVLTSAVVGVVSIGSGMWRSSDRLRALTARIPSLVTVVLRAAAVAVASLLAFSLVLLAIAMASSFGEVAALFAALDPTVSDAIVLAVLSVAYVPTMAIWSLAYMLGAGVSLGPDVLLSPFVPAIPPTPLPAFPPLAALPETAAPAVWAFPALTVLAGGLMGLLVSRFAAREGPLVRIAIASASVALAAASVFVLLAAGSGSLGDGRLLRIGPDPALGALLAGAGLLVGSLPTSVLRARRRPRRLQPVTADE